MERKHYRWIWWIAVLLIIVAIIWLIAARNRTTEYIDGTLVWNTEDAIPSTCYEGGWS